MEIMVDFPGGARVDAHFGAFTVPTDQPVFAGGQGQAPSPFETFLASIATCAGFYVLDFCRRHQVSSDGIRVIQRIETDPATKLVGRISIEILLPPEFPEKYKTAVIRSAEQCKVKKHFEHPPAVEVRATVSEAVPAG
jgi:putative redox protein